VALHQLPHMRDTSADWAVHVFPIAEEILVGHTRLLWDAVDDLDHGWVANVAVVEDCNANWLSRGHIVAGGSTVSAKGVRSM
jgi:hypothetical protein